jgi:hypothetical protein
VSTRCSKLNRVNLLKLSEHDYDANFNTTDASKVRYGCLFIAAEASERASLKRASDAADPVADSRPNLCSQACAVDAQ